MAIAIEPRIPPLDRVAQTFQRQLERVPQAAVAVGLPPSWLGYRWMREESVPDYVSRAVDAPIEYDLVHPRAVAKNPPPRNVSRSALPRDSGWWGYSFHDVPERVSGETFVATLPECRLLTFEDEVKGNFHPAILTQDGRALTLREIKFREGHARVMRSSASPVRLERATWILERVFDNHSHWLTAHLPKLCLLKARGALDELVLPPRRSAVMDESMRLLGLDPDAYRTFDPDRPLEVGELTILGTDRFRPELLRPVRAAFAKDAVEPTRRIYISRARAPRRRLLDEETIWPLLERAGFERVFMEEYDFEAQVRLMQQTAVLFAPHGAGLTNMMFCPEGADIVEIADLDFPNPNFYALASAMGHRYWLIPAEGVGGGHPLEKDMTVGPEKIARVLEALER